MKYWSEDIAESMAVFVNRFLGLRYCSSGRGLSVTRRGMADDILRAACAEGFDLVILALDNVIYGSGAGARGCALGLIRQLRGSSTSPSSPRGAARLGPAFAGRALTAGQIISSMPP